MGRVLVVHATNLLLRGYLTVSTDRRSDAGQPTNALYAVTRSLRRALSFKTPDLAVAVVDTELDEGKLPPLLRQQVKPLQELLRAHGIPCALASDAVHVVASYVSTAVDAGHDVVIVGSDKRLAQLVSDRVWWYDAYKDVRYTPELVRKRFEVEPAFVAGWLAMVGDDDALPGVKGIGKKGATTLVQTYGSVNAALERAEEVGGRTGKALRASLEAARRELGRARLDTQKPLPAPLDELRFEEPDVSSLNERYVDLGFYALLETHADTAAPEVVICDTEDGARRALDALGVEPVALHAITADPSPPRGDLIGLALSQRPGHALYFPFAGKGRCLERCAALETWLADASRPKVGHDVKVAVLAFARRGGEVAGVVADSACASHLTEPSGFAPHDLQLVARRTLHRAVDEEDAVRGVGRRRKGWGELSVEKTAAFAGWMADVGRALWEHFAPRFESGQPRELLDEYLALSDTLVQMERHGIGCDADDLARAGDDFEATERELEAEIFELAGKSFNLGSTKQLGSVLFEDLGLTIMKRTKTGWSTATEALERIAHEHPIVPLVIRWRLLRRLRDSWVTALLATIDDDGRVRSTFNPARSFSGRIVNSSPDLGRVPGRTEEMARIRHAFVPAPGSTLLSVDYVQLGLYVLAHLTEDPALVEPLRDQADMHTLTASAVLELPVEQIGPDERQKGKVVNFATFAGQGASALALQLGVTAKEAKEIVARFDRRYAVVRRFQDEQLRLARERGYIQTIAGRRWPIGGLASLDTQMLSYAERLARRATHEGSVADVTRRGLLRADQAIRDAGLSAKPLLQVHDEVLFEVHDDELHACAEVASEAMRGAFDLKVPLRVTCKAGPNWADLAPL